MSPTNAAESRPGGTPVGTLLAGIIHELRNPVFALGATLDALEQRLGDRTEVRPHLEVLRSEVDRIMALARDLGELAAPLGPTAATDTRALVSRLVADRERAAQRGQVALVVRLPSALPEIEADAGRLALGLGRLLDFAIARTPAGASVAVHAHADAAPEAVRLVVSDGGGPLEPRALADALAPFGVRRAGRLTLDLAVAAAVAEQHGGRMAVENVGREGLRYAVTLPVRAPGAGG